MPRFPPKLNTRQQDAVRVVGFLIGYLVTALIPSSWNASIVRGATRLLGRIRPASTDRHAQLMAKPLARSPADLSETALRRRAASVEGAWVRVRGLHRRGWRPHIEIEGIERIRAALERTQGVMLWRMSFCGTPVVKRALWEAGIPLVHLSKQEHGAHSDAWVSRRMLTPLFRRAEDWYLTERVIIPWGGSPVGAMRTLLKRLQRDHAVVSIMGDAPWQPGTTARVFDRDALFARGAPLLAARSGALLLPVVTVWESENHYRVVIGHPINLVPDLDRDRQVDLAIAEFADRMERAIREHPESWSGWSAYWSGSPPFLPEAS